MIDILHHLVEQYGLIAIFLGCVAEGESAAILGGFFSHQALFSPWAAFLMAAAGAFLGDTLFFVLGRRFSTHPYVVRLRHRPGFSHAMRLVEAHPSIFVLSNRYIYGLRLVGGVASGMANIPAPKFLVLNLLSSLVWAALFGSLGYFFGIGAERIIGDTLRDHHRLVIGLGIGLATATVAWLIAHHMMKKEPKEPD